MPLFVFTDRPSECTNDRNDEGQLGLSLLGTQLEISIVWGGPESVANKKEQRDPKATHPPTSVQILRKLFVMAVNAEWARNVQIRGNHLQFRRLLGNLFFFFYSCSFFLIVQSETIFGGKLKVKSSSGS